jgi:hypothetical protein
MPKNQFITISLYFRCHLISFDYCYYFKKIFPNKSHLYLQEMTVWGHYRCTPIILGLRRLRQEFRTSLSYILRLCLKKKRGEMTFFLCWKSMTCNSQNPYLGIISWAQWKPNMQQPSWVLGVVTWYSISLLILVLSLFSYPLLGHFPLCSWHYIGSKCELQIRSHQSCSFCPLSNAHTG